jgi:hypothetical protein
MVVDQGGAPCGPVLPLLPLPLLLGCSVCVAATKWWRGVVEGRQSACGLAFIAGSRPWHPANGDEGIGGYVDGDRDS